MKPKINDILICIKNFKTHNGNGIVKEGTIINYTPRSKKTTTEEINKKFPIGAFYTDNITMCYIYIDELNEHFKTTKEYRKLKLKKLNEKM